MSVFDKLIGYAREIERNMDEYGFHVFRTDTHWMERRADRLGNKKEDNFKNSLNFHLSGIYSRAARERRIRPLRLHRYEMRPADGKGYTYVVAHAAIPRLKRNLPIMAPLWLARTTRPMGLCNIIEHKTYWSVRFHNEEGVTFFDQWVEMMKTVPEMRAALKLRKS